MEWPDRIAIYGLTGGIGSGKSEVARVLASAGIPVIDADRVARDQMRRGGRVFDEVVAEFGDSVLGADGEVDREALARIVFGDPDRLARLNTITHARVMDEVGRRLCILAGMGHRAAVVEAALLVETGLHRRLDGLLVVTASEDTRVQRVCDRDGVSAEDVRARMASQAPEEEKIAVSTWAVENDSSLDQLRHEVAAVAAAMAGRGKR